MSERIYSETFEPGTIIVKIGDPGDYAYIVQKGKVEVSVPSRNGKKVLAELGQGEIFGEMAIIDSSPRSATVTAIETTEVIIIELSKHMKILAYNNPIMDLVLRVVLSRLRKTSQQVTGRLAPNLGENNALKKTSELIPLCHPIAIDHTACKIIMNEEDNSLEVFCVVSTYSKTGVEMEAIMGVNAALVTIYDLSKIVNPNLKIDNIRLLIKEGGKNGLWKNPEGIPDSLKDLFK